MNISREWAMPSKDTFKIKPIKKFLERSLKLAPLGHIVDPYVRDSVFKPICHLTNDLNPSFEASAHMDAGEFLDCLENETIAFLFFDPPYSPRQVQECYQGIGKKVTIKDTQSSFYSRVKDIAKDKIMPGGLVACFGWNSNGFGKSRGFEMIEILLVPHGSNKYDTICTLERKL